MWYSAKVSSHQQEAWGGRASWKVQTACTWTHTDVQYTHMHLDIQATAERLMGCAQNQGCHRSQRVTVKEHILWLTLLIGQQHSITNNRTKSNMKSNMICSYSVEFCSSILKYIHRNCEFEMFKLLCLLFCKTESNWLCICLQYFEHTHIQIHTFPHRMRDKKGDGGINGSVPNFPQPPSSNQII